MGGGLNPQLSPPENFPCWSKWFLLAPQARSSSRLSDDTKFQADEILKMRGQR